MAAFARSTNQSSACSDDQPASVEQVRVDLSGSAAPRCRRRARRTVRARGSAPSPPPSGRDGPGRTGPVRSRVRPSLAAASRQGPQHRHRPRGTPSIVYRTPARRRSGRRPCPKPERSRRGRPSPLPRRHRRSRTSTASMSKRRLRAEGREDRVDGDAGVAGDRRQHRPGPAAPREVLDGRLHDALAGLRRLLRPQRRVVARPSLARLARPCHRRITLSLPQVHPNQPVGSFKLQLDRTRPPGVQS